MKKLSISILVLLVFISCGKTGSKGKTKSSDSYLKVLSVTPTSSGEDAKINEPITIKFSEKIKEVSIALINKDATDGQIAGDTKIEDDKVIFTPTNDLDYSTYKVNIDKVGTTSSNDKTLEESYSSTFTIYPKNENTIPNIPKDKKEEETKPDTSNKPDTSGTSDKLDTSGIGLPANTDESYNCKLVPCG